MARAFLVPIDLTNQEIRNVRLQSLAAPPQAGALPGLIWFDTNLGAAVIGNGSGAVPADPSKHVGTIPISALVIDPTMRANHSGVQPSSTINDLAQTVQGYTLDLFAKPANDLDANGHRLLNVADPTQPTDAANLRTLQSAVQAAAAGISSKPPADALSTDDIATLSGTPVVDGYQTKAGDRILLTGQSNAARNGIYIVDPGNWQRSSFAGVTGEIETGSLWLVTNGNRWRNTQWIVATPGPFTLGQTNIEIVEFSAGLIYSASAGLDLTGGAFSAKLKPGGGILVDANGLYLDFATGGATKKFVQTIGDGSQVQFNIQHQLSTQDVIVQARSTANPFGILEADFNVLDANTVQAAFAAPPASGAVRVTVIG